MAHINKNKIEQFLQWEGGQRLFNFAYSIGAAIVILGALFKILHISGGNTLLMVGMGTEVVMFILTAFDRPPKEYNWEQVFPGLVEKKHDTDASSDDAEGLAGDEYESGSTPTTAAGTTGMTGGGTVIIGGGTGGGVIYAGGASQAGMAAGDATAAPAGVNAGAAYVAPAVASGLLAPDDAEALSATIARMNAASAQLETIGDMTAATRDYMTQLATISGQLQRLGETTRALNQVSEVLLDTYKAITENSENITRSSTGYVEQMEALNRNVHGLNTIYEIQLKSVSSQIDSIDRVNRGIKDIRDMYERGSSQSARYCEETEKMARYMQQLNSIYANMIQAMTVNMYRPMPGAPITGQGYPFADSPAEQTAEAPTQS